MGPREKQLRRGRKIRREVGQRLEDLESGRINIRDALEEPGVLGRVSIYTLLCRTPKLGPAGVKKTLQATGTWPQDRVANLSQGVRQDILKHLPPRVANTYRQSGSKVDTMI